MPPTNRLTSPYVIISPRKNKGKENPFLVSPIKPKPSVAKKLFKGKPNEKTEPLTLGTFNSAIAQVLAELTALKEQISRKLKRRPVARLPVPKVSSLALPRVPSTTPFTDAELERFLAKRSSSGPSRAILYFRGLGRHEIRLVKRLFATLGIPSQAIQFVSYIGANVLELVILNSFREEVVGKLATVNIELHPTFDPLSPRTFTKAATTERHDWADLSESQKSKVARDTFISRLDSMIRMIGGHRRGLGSFLRSLKKAVEEGTRMEHFFDPTSSS